MSRAAYLQDPRARGVAPDVEIRVQTVDETQPDRPLEFIDDGRSRADLEVEIPGDGLILRANVTPDRVVLSADSGDIIDRPRPVLLVVQEPEALRAAARILTLAAGEMESLRAARADVRNRERRYQPGRIRTGAHGGA